MADSIALAREAKGVEFAFARLGEEGVDAFRRVRQSTRGLLTDLDIKTSLVDFDNFNLSLQDTDVLFEFLAVRAAQTGKSVDSLKDSLVEGLSKESKLRIDNLGISASELNAELEKTPDFVTAVANIARREVAEAGSILDEAANSAETLSASFQNAKLSFGQLFTGNSSIPFLGLLRSQVDKINQSFILFKDALQRVRIGVNDFIKPIAKVIQDVPFLRDLFTSLNGAVGGFFKAISQSGLTTFSLLLRNFGATLSGVGAGITEARKQIVGLIEAVRLLGSILSNPIEASRALVNGSLAEAFTSLRDETFKAGNNIGNAFRDAYNKALEPLPKEIVDAIDVDEPANNLKGALEKQLPIFEGIIDKLKRIEEETFNAFINGEASIDDYRDAVKDAENALKDLTNSLIIDVEQTDLTADTSGLESYQDAQNKANESRQRAIDLAKEQSEKEQILFEAFGRLEATLGVQAGTFETIFDGIKFGFQDASEAAEAFGNIATAAFSTITENSNIKLENELQNLEIEKDTALAFAGDSAAAREQIEERFDKRQKEIKTKQAKNDRAAALFDIGIATAVAVVKALPNIPLSLVIGALGATQALAVAATPLPEFKDGVTGFDGGLAIINDQKGSSYKETVRTPDGQLTQYSGRNVLVDLPKGSDVLTASETNELERMLGENGINGFGDAVYNGSNPVFNIQSNGITESQMDSILGKHLANRPTNVTNINKSGISTLVQNGHSKKILKNNSITFKSKSV